MLARSCLLQAAKKAQLVVMCLQRGEEIWGEVHPDVDQFFRIEQGEAKFIFNEKEAHVVHDGEAVIVPAGTFHNVINTGRERLKLYTIYSPPNYPDGTVHKTKAEAWIFAHRLDMDPMFGDIGIIPHDL